MTAERWRRVRASAIVLSTLAKSATAPAAATGGAPPERQNDARKTAFRVHGTDRHTMKAKNITAYDNYCPRGRFIARRCRERRGANAFFSPILAFSPNRVSRRSFIYANYTPRDVYLLFFLLTRRSSKLGSNEV